MDAIATQLGVSKGTISNDLANCLIIKQLKPTETASNPKGAGRPKGKKSQRTRKRTDSVAADIVRVRPGTWKRERWRAR